MPATGPDSPERPVVEAANTDNILVEGSPHEGQSALAVDMSMGRRSSNSRGQAAQRYSYRGISRVQGSQAWSDYFGGTGSGPVGTVLRAFPMVAGAASHASTIAGISLMSMAK